jgi:hypothetical protein
MKTPLAEIIIIVDVSGSMAGLKAAQTADAVNKLLQHQRLVAGDCLVTLGVFATEYMFRYEGVPLAQAPPMPAALCGGGTALMDAVHVCIGRAEQRHAKVKPDAVSVVLITDGEENSSHLVDHATLRKEIAEKEGEGWDFGYVIIEDHEWAGKQGVAFARSLGFSAALRTGTADYAATVQALGDRIALRRADLASSATRIAPEGYVTKMANGRFCARLMRAPRLTGDLAQQLPVGYPLPVYPVAALPGAPKDWLREAGCYAVPVSQEWGLWFDWRDNDELNTAVLPSVKGMNPITGQKIEKVALARHDKECPEHRIPLMDGGLCPECGYKKPAQNYVAHPAPLYWDGFRQADGTVRQFFFTADEARDVASAKIGKANTVPAFGFAFFEPVKARVGPQPDQMWGRFGYMGPVGVPGSPGLAGIPNSYPLHFNSPLSYAGYAGSAGMHPIGVPNAYPQACSTPLRRSHHHGAGGQSLDPYPYGISDGVSASSFACAVEREEKTCGASIPIGGIQPQSMLCPLADVSVGAGAQITQELATDDLKPEDYKPEPTFIRLYFVFPEQWANIVRKGVKSLKGAREGFLKGVPVG